MATATDARIFTQASGKCGVNAQYERRNRPQAAGPVRIALHCRFTLHAYTMKYTLILISSLYCSTAMADTLYKCVDKATETVLYTNQRVSGKQCSVVSSIRSAPTSSPRASATPTPGDFPRVNSETQKERDGGRRTILEQELASEQRNLEEAKKSSNTNKAQLHERNIVALQKEIANLK